MHGQAACCKEGIGIVHGAAFGCKECAWSSHGAPWGCMGYLKGAQSARGAVVAHVERAWGSCALHRGAWGSSRVQGVYMG